MQIALGSSVIGAQAHDLLKLDYSYGGANNNGNVLSQTITVSTAGQTPGFVATQAYSYDPLNRIKQAAETIPNQAGWQQAFVYDRYGNRNFEDANTSTLLKPNGGKELLREKLTDRIAVTTTLYSGSYLGFIWQ